MTEVEVHCKVCGTAHRPALTHATEGCTQGVDCDGQVAYAVADGRWYLLCAYGSSLDGNLYQFADTPGRAWRNSDPVCDACVREACLRGDLIQVPGDFPLGFEVVDGRPVPNRSFYVTGEQRCKECGRGLPDASATTRSEKEHDDTCTQCKARREEERC